MQRLKYDVVERQKLSDFAETITNYIEQGWRCQGGVSVIERPTSGAAIEVIYRQAMISGKEPK